MTMRPRGEADRVDRDASRGASHGTDLSLPLLMLLGLIPVVLVIRETRRGRR